MYIKEINNDITINSEDILKLDDYSITDGETIRQIALYSIKYNDDSLIRKINPLYEVAGLYPHVMRLAAIKLPEKLK